MKNYKFFLPLLALLSSCEVVKGIFKAGFWSGAILVILVIAIVIFVIVKLVGGKK